MAAVMDRLGNCLWDNGPVRTALPGSLTVLGEDVQVRSSLGIRLAAERGGAGTNRSEKR